MVDPLDFGESLMRPWWRNQKKLDPSVQQSAQIQLALAVPSLQSAQTRLSLAFPYQMGCQAGNLEKTFSIFNFSNLGQMKKSKKII